MSYIEIADKALKEFATTGLKPNADAVTKGNLVVQQVFKLLQQKSRYPPARCIVGGSTGKATAIPGSDYDLVVFINDEEPGYETILDDYENVLLLTNHPKCQNLYKTKHSVHFQVNDIEIDLVPATNYVAGFNNLDGDALAEEQADRVLKKIQVEYRASSKTVYERSSSLVEYHVLFMKRQSAFVHELARICKFWSRTLILGRKVSGQSTIIDLVATRVGQVEENNQSPPSILRAFRRFLEKMKNMDTMGIEFNITDRNLTCSPPAFNKPFLIEPSNPFNNLLKGVEPAIMDKFNTFATETLRRLENEIRAWAMMGNFPFELLFQVQPKMVIPKIGTTPKSSMLTIIDYSSKNPSMLVRNEKKFTDEIVDMQIMLKFTLFTAIHALTSTSTGKSDLADGEVEAHAKSNVSQLAYGVASQMWGPSNINHEDHDVTFDFPFHHKPKAIRVSFTWD